MVCPDCKNSKWDLRETKQFLEILPLTVALVDYTVNTRRYWNWDKSKYIYTIETDHKGNYISIKFHKDYWRKSKSKKKKYNQRLITIKITMNLKRIFL